MTSLWNGTHRDSEVEQPAKHSGTAALLLCIHLATQLNDAWVL